MGGVRSSRSVLLGRVADGGRGYMQYLYDETGRRYLDMFAGIVTAPAGHSHPNSSSG